ncbi:MAG: chitobiase/beta-hexosaminidase C-terminal domain-containing protein [Candidatus Omnitrophota bacterium]
MRFKIQLIKSFCLVSFLGLVFTLNVFAGLSEAERDELQRLQVLVEKNAEISEGQMQRWEELLLKDPDNLKKIRQKEINKWADSLRAQGKEVDQVSIDRQSEAQWQDFLKEKDKKLMALNENNMVLLLGQIRDACRILNQKEEAYPADLNTLMLNNQTIIEPALEIKLKKIYSIRYEKTYDSYRVFAFPLDAENKGNKKFLLDKDIIYFTLDGSTPTLQSNRIL